MRLVEYARRHPLPAAALSGLALGTALGLVQPIRASAPDPAELAAWTPYERVSLQRYDEVLFARIRDRPIWDGEQRVAGRSGAAREDQWRLAGIITNPLPMAALVFAQGSDTAVQLRIGDTLPDGGKILDITSRSIRFARAGCEYERALYSADEQADADCGRP